MHASEIGQRFLQNYQEQGFVVMPSSSLLDPAIPTTFVMSAGLTQIETTLDRSKEHTGERYVLLQTCFRHFDLDKIGQSTTHLSLFRMGGIFYFGAENRAELLTGLWSFLTKELGLSPERLVATYFAGGVVDGYRFEANTETAQLWRQIGLTSEQIIGVEADGAFWKQGDGISGQDRFRKCGPATELFWDRGPELRCGNSCGPGCKCERFIEIANVLFIHSQFDQVTHSISPLVTPFDEAVIGVERIAMALQEQASVFDIDCMVPLIERVRYANSTPALISGNDLLQSQRIIADHIRALVFLVADGAPQPSKRWGRARIIRDLIRATLTHQKALEIANDAFIHDMVDLVLELYQGQCPHLAQGRGRILSYITQERKQFEQTLTVGYRRLERLIERDGKGTLSGTQALDVVKQYGVPLVLLEMELTRRNMQLNWQEYQQAYARWKESEVYKSTSNSDSHQF